MAKKKKGKVVQMLSPEKYIKQNARKLPIGECWINSEWKEGGLANITVTRRHTNGNLTLGLFLIDLKCLGVKSCSYRFNISTIELEDLLDNQSEAMDLEQVEYKLVHNIIYAGIEFAEEYGFKPHKNFELSQYILEEDTDDIELMEIECGGEDGKPLYIQGPLDNSVRSAQILAQLEKTAGKGNYDFFKETVPFEEDEEMQMTIEEKVELFVEMVADIENLDKQDRDYFDSLMNEILNEKVDYDLVFELEDEFLASLDKYGITDEFTNEVLFGCYTPDFDAKKIVESFPEVFSLLQSDIKKAIKRVKKLQSEYPHNPAVSMLELNCLQHDDLESYSLKVREYHQHYPQHAGINLLYQIELCNVDGGDTKQFKFTEALKVFFPDRESLHYFELVNLFILLIYKANIRSSIIEIEALSTIVDELEFDKSTEELFYHILNTSKIKNIMELYVAE